MTNYPPITGYIEPDDSHGLPARERGGLGAPPSDEPRYPGQDVKAAEPRPQHGTLVRTVKEFSRGNLSDWAAALTYYGVLSIFPGLLVLISVLGLLGQSNTQPLTDELTAVAPGQAQSIIDDAIDSLQQSQASAGVLAIVGLLGALWAASGYIGAFMRASNVAYNVPEGRPLWKTLPLRLVVTIVVGAMLIASTFLVVFTGRLAEMLGDFIGAGSTFTTIWDLAKWPVLLILVSVTISILYWVSPNARTGGFKWISPGGLLAVALWLIASAGFAFYVANFGDYNKTYGALGGIILFLVWLWISNMAILFGEKFNAELQRKRAIAEGASEDQEPYVALRDIRTLPEKDKPDPDRVVSQAT